MKKELEREDEERERRGTCLKENTWAIQKRRKEGRERMKPERSSNTPSHFSLLLFLSLIVWIGCEFTRDWITWCVLQSKEDLTICARITRGNPTIFRPWIQSSGGR